MEDILEIWIQLQGLSCFLTIWCLEQDRRAVFHNTPKNLGIFWIVLHSIWHWSLVNGKTASISLKFHLDSSCLTCNYVVHRISEALLPIKIIEVFKLHMKKKLTEKLSSPLCKPPDGREQNQLIHCTLHIFHHYLETLGNGQLSKQNGLGLSCLITFGLLYISTWNLLLGRVFCLFWVFVWRDWVVFTSTGHYNKTQEQNSAITSIQRCNWVHSLCFLTKWKERWERPTV